MSTVLRLSLLSQRKLSATNEANTISFTRPLTPEVSKWFPPGTTVIYVRAHYTPQSFYITNITKPWKRK